MNTAITQQIWHPANSYDETIMPSSEFLTSSNVALYSFGIILGPLIVYLFMKSKQANLVATKELEYKAQLQIASDRTDQKQAKINELTCAIAEYEKKLRRKDETHTAQIEITSQLRERISELETRLADLQTSADQQSDFINKSQQELKNAFKALASDIQTDTTRSFLALAKEALSNLHQKNSVELKKQAVSIQELFKPVQKSLTDVDSQIRQVEKERAATYASLTEQIKGLTLSQSALRNETSILSKALRTPSVRGRWGEIQLRRVVELAGMVEYCDFFEQESVPTETGALRPDMIIRLPNNKEIVIDSKTVLHAYMEAQEATSEEVRLEKLALHAKHVRKQMNQLSTKAYWDQFQHSPEFVVLFLPGENFFSAALEQDAHLIEAGVEQKVIIATPTTLIALLRAVSYGWRHEHLAENAQKIGELGRTLHDRLAVLSNHFCEIKKGLDKTVHSFNSAVGSYESRVMVTARQFNDLDPMLTSNATEIASVEISPRQPAS